MKTDNPSSNPIIKEAANPISHALIALKSVRDPFRTEISNIRQDIDNIINILDTSLYSLATGKENELRSITNNIQAIKTTLNTIGVVISTEVAGKIIDTLRVNNISLNTVQSNDVASNNQVVNTNTDSENASSIGVKSIDASSPDELIKSFEVLKNQYIDLAGKIVNSKSAIKSYFVQIDKKEGIVIPEYDGEKKLKEVLLKMVAKADSIYKSLDRAIETSLSKTDNAIDLMNKINSQTVSRANFDSAIRTYRTLVNHYKSLSFRYGELTKHIGVVKHQVEFLIYGTGEDKSDEIENIENDIEKKSAQIIISQTYNKVLFDFIIKQADAPNLLQEFHRGVNEVGQDLISPISDTVRRRIRIRKSLKAIKKVVVDMLLEIRRTSGKKESIELEISRWNAIIKSFNDVGQMLSKEITNTLIPQLSMSNAEVFSQRLRERDNSQISPHDSEQIRMQRAIPALQYTIPMLPSMQDLIKRKITNE